MVPSRKTKLGHELPPAARITALFGQSVQSHPPVGGEIVEFWLGAGAFEQLVQIHDDRPFGGGSAGPGLGGGCCGRCFLSQYPNF